MLTIKTPQGSFGHPKDLLHYMKDKELARVHIKVEYCFEEVFEKDMSLQDVTKWASTFVSPIAGTLEGAIEWLRLGGE